jgi:prepilin-type N-terminal cleavage/methylation domain-containing protein
MKKFNKKYEAFSLVEMLITISIMGMVMLISSSVLTSLIKVSTVASNKIRARNESEFVLELMRRTIRNSDPSEVYIFKSNVAIGAMPGRKFDPEEQTVTGNVAEEVYAQKNEEGEPGNEIHFRPYGFRDWICLGFFKSTEETEDEDEERGYIVWTSGEDLTGQHETCFAQGGQDNYTMVLNSEYINIKNFEVSYVQSSDGNYIISFEILSEPLRWYLGAQSPINREILRQATVSTEGVVW